MIVVTNEELEALGTEDVLEADDGDDFTGGDDDLDFDDGYSEPGVHADRVWP